VPRGLLRVVLQAAAPSLHLWNPEKDQSQGQHNSSGHYGVTFEAFFADFKGGFPFCPAANE